MIYAKERKKCKKCKKRKTVSREKLDLGKSEVGVPPSPGHVTTSVRRIYHGTLKDPINCPK